MYKTQFFNKSSEYCFFFVIFCFFLCFYTLFHPILLTTPDDWYYISYTRDAFPLYANHNPTRVLPEVLMPLVAGISSIVLRPFFDGDFVWAIAMGTALLLASLITAYAYNICYLIKKFFSLDNATSYCLTAFFLLFHFLILRHTNLDNQYLFGAFCLTNYYYYTIAILVNLIFTIYSIRTNMLMRLKTMSFWNQGLVFIVTYLCLLSNLYSSIILISYLSIYLLGEILYEKKSIIKVLANNRYIIITLISYLVVLWLESCGGNAKALSQNENYLVEIRKTLAHYHYLIITINSLFKWVTGIVVLIAFFIFIKKNKTEKKSFWTALRAPLFIVFNFIVLNVFSLLISAKANPHYVAMQDKAFMELFWFLIGTIYCLAYIVKKIPQMVSFLPLLFVILFCHTNTKTKTFCDVYGYYTMPSIYKDMVSCVKQASEMKADSLILYVPLVNKNDNWPFLLYTGKDFSNTFYSLRLTHKRINIKMQAVPNLKTITSNIAMNSQSTDSVATSTNFDKENEK